MATLPTTGDDLDLISFAVEIQPSYTHKLGIEQNRVRGMTDEQDAVLQAVYLILNVEQLRFPHLFPQLRLRAIRFDRQAKGLCHERDKAAHHGGFTPMTESTSLDGWEFETGRNWVTARFTVHTIYGDVSAEKEVDI